MRMTETYVNASLERWASDISKGTFLFFDIRFVLIVFLSLQIRFISSLSVSQIFQIKVCAESEMCGCFTFKCSFILYFQTADAVEEQNGQDIGTLVQGFDGPELLAVPYLKAIRLAHADDSLSIFGLALDPFPFFK